MRHTITATAFAALLALTAAGTPSLAQEQATPPMAPGLQTTTLRDLEKLMEQQKYPEVLQHIARISNSAKLMRDFDKGQLLALKAECLLQTRNVPQAVENFAQAAKTAEDPDVAACAAATEMLLRRSQALMYTPKSSAQGSPGITGAATRPAPIDVRDLTRRKQALAALYQDELAASKPKIDAALKATAVPALAAGVKPLTDIQLLERAATGNTLSTQKITDAFTARLLELINGSLKTMTADVSSIRVSANQVVEVPMQEVINTNNGPMMQMWMTFRRTGVTLPQQRQLNDIVATNERIVLSVDEFSKRLEGAKKTLTPAAETAQKLTLDVQKLLADDYSREVRPRRLMGNTPAGLPPGLRPR